MTTPLIILIGGATVAGTFLVGRVGLRAFQRFQAMPKTPRGFRSLPKGGFEPKMTRREAALIVQIKYPPEISDPMTLPIPIQPPSFPSVSPVLRCSERNISRQKLAERYKTVMLANHPDRGGSPYLALKINEARRILEPFAR